MICMCVQALMTVLTQGKGESEIGASWGVKAGWNAACCARDLPNYPPHVRSRSPERRENDKCGSKE